MNQRKEVTTMTKEELKSTMESFSLAYDVVRVVEPESMTVMCLDEKQYMKAQFEPCFSVWEKDKRCENCISLRACIEKKRMSKFEFYNEEAYSVLVIPILVKSEDNEQLMALELVNQVSNETIFEAHGNGAVAEEVKKLNQRAYEDSLTGAYNRRYYDENLHIYDMYYSLPQKMGYLVIDVDSFKYVNDNFGHTKGDELLIEVALVLQKNIRQSDKLIRIGGDEFLLVLRDCSRLFVEKKAVALKEAVANLSFKSMGEYRPSISVGMSYTDSFDGSLTQLKELFMEADQLMYQDKSMPEVGKKSMLIVDDISINREVLRNYFEQDFKILEASDGVQALEVLRSNIVEVVITDIYMPEMDGLTLTREIRGDSELANVIIFVVTERGEEHELSALEAGADDFINKPFNPELLSHRMKGVLSQNTVFNRISQYQLSFNQNQIAFATVRLEEGRIVFQYVNDAFAQLMSGTPKEFISGRKQLRFKGFKEFLEDVTLSHKRNTMTVHDEATHNYFDIVAYAQENGFCSFIVLKNEAMKLVELNEERYQDEFANLATVNPDTFGALFIDLNHGICEKAFGRSPYLGHFEYPLAYEEVISDLATFPVDLQAKERFLHITNRENLLTSYEKGEYNLKEEIPFRLVRGAVHWLGVHVKLIQDPQTKEPKAILYCIDIHNQKMSQFVIDTISKRNFDTLFCMDVFAGTAQIYQGDGEVYWSKPFPVSMMDDAIQEYLKIHYQEPDKEQFLRENTIPAIVEKMKDMETYSVNYPLIDEEGQWHLKKGTYTWLDETKSLMCFTREDITDIVKKEQENTKELQKINEELIHASNAKVEFLSRMSHDIRTPMNTILGLSSLAVDEVNHPEKMLEYIQNIRSSGKFLLGLVNDILDMDKINRGAMSLNLEPYHYMELISSMKLMFTSPCIQKGIHIHFQPAKVKATVMADKIRLNQIFFNIFSNALKYTPEGGDIYYKTENLKIEEGRTSCDYIIRDTGIGMSKEFQKNMFKEFSQEGKNIEVSSQGSGLGLSITKNLVELMGGTLEIESQEGIGTTVRIHLEFELVSEEIQPEEIGESGKLQGKSYKNLEGLEVLLVEDHPLNQTIAKRLLEKKGILVHCADNGEEALNLYANSEPNYFKLILMDIRMPVMDGIESTKKIRKLNRKDASEVPIIAMTANAYNEDIVLTKEAGMNGHLSKPVNPELLYETILNFI